MNKHLSEEQLIKYEFELAGDKEARQVKVHLGRCEDCQKRLEQLKNKFASLELLQGEQGVTEELISRTLAQIGQESPATRNRYRLGVWVSVAAALMIVAGVWIIAGRLQRKPQQQEIKRTAQLSKPSGDLLVARAEQDKTELMAARVDRGGLSGETKKLMKEKPPFAPASNIELVVLPRRDKVQLTIYNSADLTLVREVRNLTMKKGWNWLQFMWTNTLIDPTSLSLEPKKFADKISVEQLVFPPRLRELGRWLIKSEVSGQVPFEITYFTSGLKWRAFYMGTMSEDEKNMRLQGYVRVDNSSGEDYENAQTRLIVGKVHQLDRIAELAKRHYPYNQPVPKEESRIVDHLHEWDARRDFKDGDYFAWYEDANKSALGYGIRRKEIKKEGLSEYFLYTIEGMETIPDKWGKRLPSFEVDNIPVESLYKYDEERWGGNLIRFVSFANDTEHQLGQTPLPNGNIKIYRRLNEAWNLSYIGGSNVKYIPVDEEIELNLGPSRHVKIEPKLMDERTANYLFDSKGNIVGWDEVRTWQIIVNNTRKLPVEIEITRGFNTAYWSLDSNTIPDGYQKHDATHGRFTLTVKPRTKKVLTYTVRTYHGKRRESYKE